MAFFIILKALLITLMVTIGVHIMGDKIVLPVINYVVQIFLFVIYLRSLEKDEGRQNEKRR